MAGRLQMYQKPWYKRLESGLVQSLDMRFQYILVDEPVISPVAFVHAVLTHKQLREVYTASLVRIVNAVDKRARACKPQ